MISDENKDNIYTFDKFIECISLLPEECSICHGKIKVKELVDPKCMRANPIGRGYYILKYTIEKIKIDFGIEEKDWLV